MIYTFAVLDPPKSLIQHIEGLLANFFWGQIEGRSIEESESITYLLSLSFSGKPVLAAAGGV